MITISPTAAIVFGVALIFYALAGLIVGIIAATTAGRGDEFTYPGLFALPFNRG